ncbi:hypothetical protein M4D58_12390 [Brevibacillus borstelensis]|uniref:hypothetical protein n=1 Tax=Brevibacillus borstelensis TaxID=45462 RepID=UPI00203E6604|nr:hypothetical protein [Brevibacillus borstelensis]MCM3591421.1 hypothetical protein [Brevibacillus borstelensis]
MDLEKRLREFKQTADQAILREMDDTAELEERILGKARGGQKTAERKFGHRSLYKVGAAAVAAASLLLFSGPLFGPSNPAPGGHVTTGPGPVDPVPAVPPSLPAGTAPTPPAPGTSPGIGQPPGTDQLSGPSDEEIQNKVQEIKEALRIGLTQEEVKKRIQAPYNVVDDNGDLENGADEFWNISFFKQEGYVPEEPEYVVDETGLKARKVGLNLFIGWKEKKLYMYSIQYVQGEKNDIYFYMMRPNGTVGMEILNERPSPSVLDLGDSLKNAYFGFVETKKDGVLYGLKPADILKLYLHAEEEGDLLTQYAFYADGGDDSAKPSLEAFLEDVKNDPAGAENTQKRLADLRAHVIGFETKEQKPESPSGQKSKYLAEAIVYMQFSDGREALPFRLVKNQEGVWKVSWMPIQ